MSLIYIYLHRFDPGHLVEGVYQL